ncbi:MAG: ParB/RepB/Spo0J family partition protein [Dysgonamonadaceae bacterium]|jgi:ParB family chromosome partitioning protein|nr:ParB/RepB/Spo0J family partition protein [Dysgonamonadaceae bacterium]
MSKQVKSALGKGLGALITMEDVNTNGSSSINEIELSKIAPNPGQPRTVFDEEALEELAASIKSLGIIQPITLRETGQDQYQIISGERRYRASIIAGLETVPAYIRKASDENILEMALIENIQREDLNPVETALGMQKLINEYQLTQEKLSERIGKNRATIANFLRILRLPAEIQMGLKDKNKPFNMGHAKALLSLEDPSDQLMVYKQILEYGFSVRKTEEIVKEMNENEPSPDVLPKKKKENSVANEYDLLRTHLSDFFGAKVAFAINEKGAGKISIPFASEKDLERIMQLFDTIKKQ